MVFKIMNKSKQNMNTLSSKLDDDSESELDEPTSRNIEQQIDTVS